MTRTFHDFSTKNRDYSAPLNEVCEAGGLGTAERLALLTGVKSGYLSRWRQGIMVHPKFHDVLDAAIAAVWKSISPEKRAAHHANGAPHAANGHDAMPFDVAEEARAAKAAAKQRTGFVSRSFDELAALAGSQSEMVVGPWLPMQGMAMIYAWRGSGKSLLALGLAIHIATGTNFGPWRIPKARRVVFIDGEMTPAELEQRYRLLVASMELAPTAEQLRVISMMDPAQPVCLNLADRSHHKRILEAIGDAEVVFLDGSVSLWEGKEAEAWVVVGPFIRDLKRRGKTVIFLHQAGKDREQRDVSDHEDLLHTSIQLVQRKHQNGVAFEAHFRKARAFFGADAEPIRFEFSEGVWSWSRARASETDSAPERAGADAGDDQHLGRALRVLRDLPTDRWQAAAPELNLGQDALVLDKRVFQAAFADQWRDEDGQSPKPDTIRKTIRRVLTKLERQQHVRLIHEGSKTWIVWSKAGVP